VTQEEALKDCKRQGLRLPVFQEMYDFCFAPGAEMSKRRCSNVWVASLNTNSPTHAWNIDPISDVPMHDWARNLNPANVRCVGVR
jgi:hypothetical protein